MKNNSLKSESAPFEPYNRGCHVFWECKHILLCMCSGNASTSCSACGLCIDAYVSACLIHWFNFEFKGRIVIVVIGIYPSSC